MIAEIKKIVILGDLTRPLNSKLNQGLNGLQQWVYELFNWQLRKTTGLPVSFLVWEKDGFFDAHIFYQLMNKKLATVNDWFEIYDEENITEEAISYVEKFIKDAIVISFEISPVLSRILNKLNIPYIDIIHHPYRFLDDLILGFRTNRKQVFENLIPYRLDDSLCHMQANIHKAAMTWKQNMSIVKNSALFAGQTNIDRSLYYNGQVLTLQNDFREKFQALGDTYNKVYYKPHPYNKDLAKIIQYLKKLSFVEILEDNIYQTLSNPNIMGVYSITSSVVYEAPFFDKKAEFFHKPWLNLAKPNDMYAEDKYVSVFNSYFNPKFWADILEKLIETDTTIDLSIPHKANRLRITMNQFWGYSFLDTDICLDNSESYKKTRNITRWVEKKIKYIYFWKKKRF
ncbi:hypothetical protein Ctha_1040 [Chloroherpeton thalassium ATCC 35110]|uniref:Uncharacterized protein n=1 Tax=Chloroherpeton thalassium (strain ATCC 35110 / GB-78) TaxID=517418 RepID=B3QXX6_CHLT3|nr:polysialyltransferase family glycosyltransferase [Chloroherpeton thalassium]ACF13504.1 hypothetical protein Ctha_1040 [Chloroherpeton thalassium ATCC 35110]